MELCKKFINFICYIFWWILFITISPIILIIFILFFFYKFIIIESIAKLLISKTIQRLDSFDNILATDLYWSNPLSTIGLVLIVDGKIDIEQFRANFKKTILEAKTSTGKLIYKKLITIPIEFGGYYFWKNYTSFETEKHITKYTIELPNKINKATNSSKNSCWNEILESFCTTQTKIPFPNGMPLWDITILSNEDNITDEKGNNTTTIKSAVYFRFHHSIADGYTVIKLVDRLTGLDNNSSSCSRISSKKISNTLNLNRTNIFQSTIEMIKSTFMAPSIIGHFYSDNVFHSDIFTKKKSSTNFLISWTSISLNELKSIRQRTKTRFPSLGISLLCGSLHKHFNYPSKLENTRVMVPLPWANHPAYKKMTNHWTMGIVKASCKKNAHERLKITDRNFSTMLKSGTPFWCRLIGPKFLTLLPKSFLKFIVNSNRIANGIIFTSVPGSSEKSTVNLLGKQVQNMIPMIGTQYSQTGFVCVIFTYNGKANCTIAGNLDLIQNQENLNKICNEFIHKELESLLLNDAVDDCIKEDPVPNGNIKLLNEIV